MIFIQYLFYVVAENLQVHLMYGVMALLCGKWCLMVNGRIGIGQTRTSSRPWRKPSDYHLQWFVINIIYVLSFFWWYFRVDLHYDWINILAANKSFVSTKLFFFVGLSRSHSSTYVRLLAKGTIASSQVFSHCQNVGQADQITRASQENCKAKVKGKATSTTLNSLLNKRYRKLHQRFFGVSVANACVKLKMEIHLFS